MTIGANERRRSKGRWVIFDADNTLWNIEGFYNSARTQMADHVATLCSRESVEIERYQQKRDRELREVYG